tara:strand:- start:406 stop:924 length:519 start_codon:yes stop_codon:yes gene_type:complete
MTLLEELFIDFDTTQFKYVIIKKFLTAIITLLGYIIIGLLLKRFIRKIGSKFELDEHIINLLCRTTMGLFIVLGVISSLTVIGINVSAIIAGLGLSGFAIGYALKDSISNLLSGILILLYKPFEVNNNIVIGDHEGKIKHIDLRYTTLINDRDEILIPNSKMFTDPITIKNK